MFMQHTSLPGSPVVLVDATAFTNVFQPKGWTSHPGPVTPPTFALPATAYQLVKMSHALLPGKVLTVPYIAFYGTHGFQSQGWTLVP